MTKPEPQPRVAAWLRSVQSQQTYLSVITIGDIQEGIDRMRTSARRRHLHAWFDELLRDFSRRILAIDTAVARTRGSMRAVATTSGKPLPIADTYIAATAIVHDLVLVSRNTRDLAAPGIQLFDPFSK